METWRHGATTDTIDLTQHFSISVWGTRTTRTASDQHTTTHYDALGIPGAFVSLMPRSTSK